LDEYRTASQQAFAGHSLAGFIRNEFRSEVAHQVGRHDRLLIKGSAGQGTWARGPWLAVFDRVVTSSAQCGYYPVYLFREDMAGVYLSLNQGVTEAKLSYKSNAKTALKASAANFRAMLGGLSHSFPTKEIDLAVSSPTAETALYEAGHICGKYYDARSLPSERQLSEDLHGMLAIYEALLDRKSALEAQTQTEGDEPPDLQYEDASRLRIHKRIERNAKLVDQVKRALGYVCQVCHTDFGARYGDIGKGYIEAHHLRPLASLQGQRVAMHPTKDFAVLCANCHRMIHRSGYVDDIERFKAEHYQEH